MRYFHESVLTKEAIDFLRVKRGDLYIDATLGAAGHTREILKKGGKVLAIDRDPESTKFVETLKLKNLKVVNNNFSHIYKIAIEFGITKVSGILFDLGVSSHQIKDAKRGFSFRKNGPLDMRMEPNLAVTAADIVNNFEKRRLYEIFQNFADERLSRPIADAIFSTRQIKRISSTGELAQIIREVYARHKLKTKTDPATKVFQALRIIVNSELLNLEEGLLQTEKLLIQEGRLVVISFHSLEDAIVKRFFKGSKELKVLTKSPIGPTREEIERNPRSRSAKLRAAEKI
ncbi:16S rRNA (cytosine(1402)-N(4))-methyltransferase [Candidatus Curtissbacteria bacterium RIFCSPLOWO2_02_FULL_40_11]|nr:MAG: 16S rRNA (cytosine(1402)-N(4))-methyltransferase [Candidatus Curtissbacteria bacterium RIFCSPLOWO2_02_FULL_40_11]